MICSSMLLFIWVFAVSQSTHLGLSSIKGFGARLASWNLSPPVKYFSDHSKAVLFLWIICVFLCLVFLMLSHLITAALWSPAGKGLTSCSVGDVYYIFVTFPFGILGQLWYLIVSFPDLCRLSYFNGQAKQGLNTFTEILCMAVFKIIQNNIHHYHANVFVLKLLSVFIICTI